ncbi:MAG: hypothetical protein QY327_10790 [Fimbriimonadaceae bacterium]|nr:MAG: hypothetical protein UZ18_ATM001000188 [Armatimonadetes bacterium OLB18]WKZ79816.1 MAG: hypothetical protein QY327_10790 [Fimbriimonadaceae bacterium]
MYEIDQVVRQASVVAALVQRQPKIGRTALMKYTFLLQEVKGLPLGFDFTLYAYGPYDGAVLGRLSTAVRWGAVKESPVMYPGGIGYELEPGEQLDSILARDKAFFHDHAAELDWVVKEFKEYNAAGMELIGTMVFVDREAHEAGEMRTKDELIDIVLKIKPRFSKDQAEHIYERLKNIGVLVAAKPVHL